MEDPNRIRTKLRLDLNDVARQIEDLDDLIAKDKKPEYMKDRSKLIEYEKKLKLQYEKMTGLSIEQAATLKGAKKTKAVKPSKFARMMGASAGFVFMYAFFNMILHGIKGFSIYNFIDYFTGNNTSIDTGMDGLVASLTNEYSYMIIMATLMGPVVLTIIESLMSKVRDEKYSVMEGLALTLPTIYLAFRIALPNPANGLVNGMFTLTILLGFSGVSMMISGFGGGFMNKLNGFISGGLFLYASSIAWGITINEDVGSNLVYNWPFLFLPLMAVGFVMTIAFLFGFIKD